MKVSHLAVAAVGLIALSACGSRTPAENAAANIRAGAENRADAIENQGSNMVDAAQNRADQLQNRADQVRDAAENRADRIESAPSGGGSGTALDEEVVDTFQAGDGGGAVDPRPAIRHTRIARGEDDAARACTGGAELDLRLLRERLRARLVSAVECLAEEVACLGTPVATPQQGAEVGERSCSLHA